jgi:hypothetical protein
VRQLQKVISVAADADCELIAGTTIAETATAEASRPRRVRDAIFN